MHEFFVVTKPALERSLVATFGVELGMDCAAFALSKGWEKKDEILGKENPVGYLYVVGRNYGYQELKGQERQLKFPLSADRNSWRDSDRQVEPGLASALTDLTVNQRTAVILVYSFEYKYVEVAEILGISVSSVRNHLRRGMEKLRVGLGVNL